LVIDDSKSLGDEILIRNKSPGHKRRKLFSTLFFDLDLWKSIVLMPSFWQDSLGLLPLLQVLDQVADLGVLAIDMHSSLGDEHGIGNALLPD